MKTNLAGCFAAASALLLAMTTSVFSGQLNEVGKGSIQNHESIRGERTVKVPSRFDPHSTTGASDLVIKAGTWLSLTSGVKLSLGGNLANGGLIAPSAASAVIFNGRGPQSETGFALFPDLVKTGGGLLTLNNPVVMSGTLFLINGNVSLSGFSLPVNSISGGSASSYIVTPDTASGLVRQVSSAAPVLFPVGNASYNPVSIRTSTGTDLFKVSVVDSLMPTTPNKETALKRTWAIYQSNPPGTNGNIVFSVQWNSGEEGSQFDRSLGGAGSADGWRWGGTTWVKQVNSRFYDNGITVYPAIDSLTSTTMGIWTLANESGALPIQLATFVVTLVNGRNVRLDWTTLSEVNNYGFEVQRRTTVDSSFVSLSGIFVPGHGTTNEPHSYAAVDSMVPPDSVYYRLKQIDLNGSTHYSEPIGIMVPTSVGETLVPPEFVLDQNFPNPFNPSTTITFALPQERTVDLSIFNVLGEKVSTAINERLTAGYYSYRFDASHFASGIYFYRISAGDFVQTRKMVILK